MRFEYLCAGPPIFYKEATMAQTIEFQEEKVLIGDDIGVKKRRFHEVRRETDDVVFTPYIHKNGKIIWHPKGGVYKFPRYKKS